MVLQHFTTIGYNVNDELTTESWSNSSYWEGKKTQSMVSSSTAIDESIAELEKTMGPIVGAMLTNFLKNLNLQQAKYYSELLKEMIFEDVRIKSYPSKPSRKRCLFLLPEGLDAHEYGNAMKFQMSERKVFNVEVKKPENLHFADYSLLDCNNLDYQGIENKAHEYWQGTERRDISTEILYEGRYKIIEEIPTVF